MALTDFLVCLLGAFFNCFFFPAIVRMPPLWVLDFKLMLDGRFRMRGIATRQRTATSRSDYSCDSLRVEQTLD